MKTKHFFALLGLLVMGFAGCKYDEGPLLSLASKTARVSNRWIPSEVVKNGIPGTAIDSFREITFLKDGGCQMVFTDYTRDFTYNGTWIFAADQSILSINATDSLAPSGSYNNDWTILRLQENTLKVSYYQRNAAGTKDGYVVTFEPGF